MENMRKINIEKIKFIYFLPQKMSNCHNFVLAVKHLDLIQYDKLAQLHIIKLVK